MAPNFERGHLTIHEQEALFRKGLEDELARATAHVRAPMGSAQPHAGLHRIMEAAYRIVARVPHDAATIQFETIEAETDETWTGEETLLLWKTLKLLVTPMSVSQNEAKEAIEQLGGPLNEGAIREARSQILHGYAEAHRRSTFLDSEEVNASGRGVMALLDDAIIGRACAAHNKPQAPSPPVPETAAATISPGNHPMPESIYAFPSDLRFSEVMHKVLAELAEEKGWAKDNGQREAVCERAAWICGDKPLRDWSAADAKYFAKTVAKFPNDFKWGKLGVSGAMAVPFDEKDIPSNEGKERNARTINRDLSILQNVSRRLAKTHWRLKYSKDIEVDFLAYTITVVDDQEDPDRMPWTPKHLKVLYSLPLWQGGGGNIARLKPSKRPIIYMDAAYWLPLIATYTGLCREEGAGLEVDDFNFDCEVPYLVVKKNELRRLKNNSRARVMPLHPELLELGLQRYVEAIAREQKHVPGLCTPVFPELWCDDAKYHGGGEKVPSFGGRRFYAIAWRYIADATHGVMPLPETRDGKKADFHSQRTYNQSVLAAPDVADKLLAMHMGHAREGTGPKKYDRRALALGEVKELRERLVIMVREMPIVTAHIPRQKKVQLLHIRHRSRVGSAPGRDAQRKFCE
ncbi:hypothetical protein A9D12_07415 [Erythrobacter neustonensis]|uniref:Integrase n=2 Tax=Erythrobacter neustonensis TaxID=1112 RepID=A0A192D3W2_9SPHN|nr:hypothetical protein A9D12_07415 [Erythrobacter neustonensis]